jgi:hypothetical protein
MKDRRSIILSKRARRHPGQILTKSYLDLQRLRDEVRRAEAWAVRVSDPKLVQAPQLSLEKLN